MPTTRSPGAAKPDAAAEMRSRSSLSVTGVQHRLVSLTASARTRHARELFAPLGPTYDRYARLLSFGQDPRWRSVLVSRIPAESQRVLDVASGTAAVAIELVRADPGRTVVGVDQSPEMLAAGRERVAREGLSDPPQLREGPAQDPPFAPGGLHPPPLPYPPPSPHEIPPT